MMKDIDYPSSNPRFPLFEAPRKLIAKGYVLALNHATKAATESSFRVAVYLP